MSSEIEKIFVILVIPLMAYLAVRWLNPDSRQEDFRKMLVPNGYNFLIFTLWTLITGYGLYSRLSRATFPLESFHDGFFIVIEGLLALLGTIFLSLLLVRRWRFMN